MATSNIGGEPRERYTVEDVKAKVQVDRISKELKVLEVDDKDFYVCVNRDVKSKFIKADESKDSKEDKIDQFVVKHRETITVVQGLGNTKLTNPDEWIIRINRELLETTFFKGKEIIDKVSQRRENLERNKKSPIIQAAIAKELLKRSNEEQKIESDPDQKEENNNFAPETTPEWSPNTTEDEPDTTAPIAKELLKRSNEEQKIESDPDTTKDEPVIEEGTKEEPPKEQPIDPVVEKKKSSPKASPVKNVTLKEPTNDTSKDAVQKTANDVIGHASAEKFKIKSYDVKKDELVKKEVVTTLTKKEAEISRNGDDSILEIEDITEIDENANAGDRCTDQDTPDQESRNPVIAENSQTEAAAEAGNQRVREVFHMDVAELIIERNA